MEQYIGEIRWFGFDFAPPGWAKCDGSLLPIAQNSALFSLLGVSYGGNGVQTFGLPDLRGRYMMSAGKGPGMSARTVGMMGGTEQTTLTIVNLPSHTHQAMLTGLGTMEPGNTTNPQGALLADSGTFDSEFNNDPGVEKVSMNQQVIVSSTGGNQPFNNMPPFLVVNACIALTGLYPSRG